VTGRRRATGERHQPGGEAADTDARLVDDPNDFVEGLTVRVALHPDQCADGDIGSSAATIRPRDNSAITPR
jgi:hypothetical protein